jgi:hypothetical protein
MIAGVPTYQNFAGVWDSTVVGIFTRETPIDGYTMGVWRGNMVAEFPDTSTGWVQAKLRDIVGQTYRTLRQKFVGVAYLNRVTGEYTLMNPAAIAGTDITISGNTITYEGVYSGVDLRYYVENYKLKEELIVSEATRDNLNSPYPDNQTMVVLVTRIEADGYDFKSIESDRTLFDGGSATDSLGIHISQGGTNYFKLPFGKAFQESERNAHNRPEFTMVTRDTVINGKNYLLAGIPFNKVTDTSTYPGAIVFDPEAADVASESWGTGIRNYVVSQGFDAARNQDAGNASNGGYIGRDNNGDMVMRGMFSWNFTDSSHITAISAANIELYDATGVEAGTYSIGCYAANFDTLNLVNGAYNDFYGWVDDADWTSTIKPLSTGKITTGNYASGWVSYFTLSSAGRDTLLNAMGSYFKIILIEDNGDLINTDNGANTYARIQDARIDFTYTATPSPPDTLAQVTNVNVSKGTYADSIKLTWDYVAGATGYTIWRSTTDTVGASFSVVGATADSPFVNTSMFAVNPYTVNAPTSVGSGTKTGTSIVVTFSGASVTDGDSVYYRVQATAAGDTSSPFGLARSWGGYVSDAVLSDGYTLSYTNTTDTSSFTDLTNQSNGSTYQQPVDVTMGEPTNVTASIHRRDSIRVTWDNPAAPTNGTMWIYKVKAKSTRGTLSSYSSITDSAQTTDTFTNMTVIIDTALAFSNTPDSAYKSTGSVDTSFTFIPTHNDTVWIWLKANSDDLVPSVDSDSAKGYLKPYIYPITVTSLDTVTNSDDLLLTLDIGNNAADDSLYVALKDSVSGTFWNSDSNKWGLAPSDSGWAVYTTYSSALSIGIPDSVFAILPVARHLSDTTVHSAFAASDSARTNMDQSVRFEYTAGSNTVTIDSINSRQNGWKDAVGDSSLYTLYHVNSAKYVSQNAKADSSNPQYFSKVTYDGMAITELAANTVHTFRIFIKSARTPNIISVGAQTATTTGGTLINNKNRGKNVRMSGLEIPATSAGGVTAHGNLTELGEAQHPIAAVIGQADTNAAKLSNDSTKMGPVIGVLNVNGLDDRIRTEVALQDYGGLFSSDTSTTTVTANDTTPLSFTAVTTFLNNFTRTDTALAYDLSDSAYFLVNVNISATTGVNQATLSFNVHKDGITVPWLEADRWVQTAGQIGSVGMSGIVRLGSGTALTLCGRYSKNATIFLHHLSLTVTPIKK